MKLFAPLMRLGAVLFAAAALGAAAPAPEPEMTLGSAKAPVTLIEYASVTCSHCADFHKNVFPAFKAKYVDTGQVRFVFREIPTQPAEVAVAGFVLARCAGQGNYFKVVDHLMKGQDAFYASGDATAFLLQAGASVGLDRNKVRACVTDQAAIDRHYARVERWTAEHKIEGTPTFVINGKVQPHIHTLAELEAALRPALAQKRR
jgi:protein-disulfide isomerase